MIKFILFGNNKQVIQKFKVSKEIVYQACMVLPLLLIEKLFEIDPQEFYTLSPQLYFQSTSVSVAKFLWSQCNGSSGAVENLLKKLPSQGHQQILISALRNPHDLNMVQFYWDTVIIKYQLVNEQSMFQSIFNLIPELVSTNPKFIRYLQGRGYLGLLSSMCENHLYQYHEINEDAFHLFPFILSYIDPSSYQYYSAAKYNRLEILKYFHSLGDGATIFAMNSTTDIEIVKFLHENRKEGCTYEAMLNAAKIGRVDLVKFHYYNRTEGNVNKSIEMATYQGHFHVVRFLYPFKNSNQMLYNHPSYSLFNYNDDSIIEDVLEWKSNYQLLGIAFQSIRPNEYSIILSQAVCSGNLSVVQFINNRLKYTQYQLPLKIWESELLISASLGLVKIVEYIYNQFSEIKLNTGLLNQVKLKSLENGYWDRVSQILNA
eukprot:gene7567-9302_t